MISTSILSELKETTRPQHDAIERRVDVMRPDLTRSEYRSLLERFYGFYAPVETRLEAIHRATPLLADFAQRRKTANLGTDLAALGLTPAQIAALPLCADLPHLDSPPETLGCLYVMEGATLGGQLISRHVIKTLALTPQAGCAFFSSYGDRVGSMWRAFGNHLRHFEDDPAARQQIVAAAQETFRKMEQWL